MPRVVAHIPVTDVPENTLETEQHSAESAEPHNFERDAAHWIRHEAIKVHLGWKNDGRSLPIPESKYKQQEEIEKLEYEDSGARQCMPVSYTHLTLPTIYSV